MSREQAHRLYRDSVLINNYYKAEVTRAMKDISRELGLAGAAKFSQYFVLCELYYRHSLSMTELSEATGVTLPNISTAVSELCALGLAERRGDDADRRRAVVAVTELGRDFGTRIVKRCSAVVHDIYLDDGSDEVLAYYERALARIAALREQAGAGR